MAASWQDHLHIVSSATPGNETTTGEWKGSAPNLKPRVLPEYYAMATVRRSLDGTFHAHVLQDGEGPIVFKDWVALVRCDDWADVETWRDYLGTSVYFIYHYHDPVAHNSYTQKVFVDKIGEPQPAGPSFSYILLPVHLTDASQE